MVSNKQMILNGLLKHKGIGPEGSKSLHEEQLKQLNDLLKDEAVSIVTKGTMLVALLMLAPNEDEKIWLQQFKIDYKKLIPEKLFWLVEGKSSNDFEKLILNVIQKENLNESESKLAMNLFFSGSSTAVRQAAFLEAQRLKRETFEENLAFYYVMAQKVKRVKYEGEFLIDLADSYDGCNRINPYTLFSAILLASINIPVYCHGIDKVAPKEGTTIHQILRAAGKTPLKSYDEISNDLKKYNFAYIDQQLYAPEIYNLKLMRKEMVKRPFLATFEKLLKPVDCTGKTLVVTSYTHKAYRNQVTELIEKSNLFDEALNIKGNEATTQPALNKETGGIYYHNHTHQEFNYTPIEISNEKESVLSLDEVIKNGENALKGDQSIFAYTQITNQVMMIVSCFFPDKIDELQQKMMSSIESGKAFSLWDELT